MINVLNFVTTFAVAVYGIWIIVAAQLKKSRPAQQFQLWLLLGGILILCQVLFTKERLLGVLLLLSGCIVVSVVAYLIDRQNHAQINWRVHSLRALGELVLVVWAWFVG